MADLDREIAEEAYMAFEKQAEDIDAWEAATDDAGKSRETPGETPGETPAETDKDGVRSRPAPAVSGDSDRVDIINRHLTREQAKELTRPDYDEFDDVVDGSGIRPERLAEYTSVIPFWYRSYRDGQEKMGMLPKYPRFLDLFGVNEASAISMSDVMGRFAPELHRDLMERDRDADRLARAGAEIIARRGIDFSRQLDEDDYSVLERAGVKEPRKYRTVAEVTGISRSVMDVDPGQGCVYNADYAEAMSGMFGGGAGDDGIEVVSLEEVIGGLDSKFLKGFLGKNADEIRETGDGIPDGEAAQPFVPFSAVRADGPGEILRSMRGAAGK